MLIIHVSFSNPYGRPSNRRDDRNRKGGRGGGGGNGGDNGGHRSHGSRGGGGGGGNDGNRKNWFKMTVSTLDVNYKLSALKGIITRSIMFFML